MVFRQTLSTLLLALVAAAPAAATDDGYAAQRAAMLDEVARDAARTGGLTGRARISPPVIAALGRVARHRFVPEHLQSKAYANRPLPIGYGQTISQPYIVALMSELLDPQPGDVMLEVGTGSGYQAAVLAERVAKVYTIEIVEPLGVQARMRLRELGYDTVETRIADGYYGWPEHGPYDGIVVTAAATQIPPPLVQQLKPGARMVIPVGPPFLAQTLMLVEKDADGRVSNRQVLPVRFVPLTGER